MSREPQWAILPQAITEPGLLDDCPECGLPVYESGTGLNRPVLWEGRELWGHEGCLADVQHARGWHAKSEPAFSTAGAIWDQEAQQ